MIKTIEYETSRIEDVIVDIADEIKNGWNVYNIYPLAYHLSCSTAPKMEFRVTLRKEIKYE